MNFLNILKVVGGDIISDVVPGGTTILKLVNSVLPEEYQLGDTATGNDVTAAMANMTSADQAMLMGKEFDVRLEDIKQKHDTLRTMLVRDATNPHSTRPKIALYSFYVTAFTTILSILIWGYATVVAINDAVDKASVITSVVNGWPFIASVLGIYTSLLLAYFGILKAEHQSTLNASNGMAAKQGVMDSVAGVINKFKK